MASWWRCRPELPLSSSRPHFIRKSDSAASAGWLSFEEIPSPHTVDRPNALGQSHASEVCKQEVITMQYATHPISERNTQATYLKRSIIVGLLTIATFIGALSIPAQQVDARGGRIVGGALLGAGVGAIFGGGRGAVVGAITGGILGGLSKRKRRRRRW